MAASTQQEDDIISGINVTPLVDIILVVLIIFIVTASLVLRNNIPVELPQAQSAEKSLEGSTAARARWMTSPPWWPRPGRR